MAPDPEKNEGDAVIPNSLGTADPEKKVSTNDENAPSSLGHDDSDTDSQHAADSHVEVDGKSRQRSVDEDDDEDEDEEDDRHRDPEPEGPEGLNIGIPPEEGGLSRSLSRASSARSRPLVVVPRKERRGLFAQLAFIPEVERPYDYARKTKWMITAIVAAAACTAPLGSNILYRMSYMSSVRRLKRGRLSCIC
jgi:hypothetical protein